MRQTFALKILTIAVMFFSGVLPGCRKRNFNTKGSVKTSESENAAAQLCSAEMRAKVLKSGARVAPIGTWKAPPFVNASGAWSEELVRQRWLHQNQGTQLLPLSWILNLKTDSGAPFLGDENLVAHGLLPDHNPLCNPLELPVGMTLDGSLTAERGPLGGLLEEPAQVGYTCAACHVSEWNIKGNTYRVLGGAALLDMTRFNKNLIESLKKATENPVKIVSFVSSVRSTQTALYGTSQSYLTIAKNLQDLSKLSRPVTQFGPGRLDALGNGGNFMFERYLKMFHSKEDASVLQIAESNRVELNAPVAISPLFDTPKFDWSYYGMSFREPFTRALAETVAVSAPTALKPNLDGSWNTSANASGILWLERYLRLLESPKFPLPEPGDALHPVVSATYSALRSEGKTLFWDDQKGCARCHGQRNLSSPGITVRTPWKEGTEFKLNAVPVGVVGTDGASLGNFATRTAQLPAQIRKELSKFSPLGTGQFSDSDTTARIEFPLVLESLMVGVSVSLFQNEGWGDYLGSLNKLSAEGQEALLGKRPCPETPLRRDAQCRRIRPWIRDDLPPAENPVLFRPVSGYDLADPRCVSEKLSSQACLELRQTTGWLAYRARPLLGLWATAPFLHNNSVPSICALLGNEKLAQKNPVFSRPSSFSIANTQLDTECLGVQLSAASIPKIESEFDSKTHGNSNAGHRYSQDYSGVPAQGVVGPALSEREIFAIIEYLKSGDMML